MSRNMTTANLQLLLLLLLGAAARAATVRDAGGLGSRAVGPYDSYHEQEDQSNRKLFKACGMPLVFLMISTCERRGGIYVPEKDPVLEAFARMTKAPTRPATGASARNPCLKRNIGQRDPFLDCCCGYCSERTLRGYCYDEVRRVSLAQFPMARPTKKSNNH